MKLSPTSVVMLTRNEEEHLPAAIENTRKWAQEIYIVDSLSTDRTVDIALEHGVRVVQRPFTNFGDQWNFALACLPIKTPWTMKLDPDERLSDKLIAEIHQIQSSDRSCEGYQMPRRLWFMGKPLHIQRDVLRLWKTGSCIFSDVLVNEYPIIDGSVGRLEGVMEHLDSPTLFHWFEKQNRYTTMEAMMRARGDRFATEPRLFGNALERRMFLKKIFFKIPFRYRLLWVYEWLRAGAYKDGMVGLVWTHLNVEKIRQIEFKIREFQLRREVVSPPKAPAGGFDPRIASTPLQKHVIQADLQREGTVSSPFHENPPAPSKPG